MAGMSAFGAHGQAQGLDDLAVGGGCKAHPALFTKIGENRRDTDVIQTGGDGMGIEHLPFRTLEKHGFVALGHTGGSAAARDHA